MLLRRACVPTTRRNIPGHGAGGAQGSARPRLLRREPPPTVSPHRSCRPRWQPRRRYRPTASRLHRPAPAAAGTGRAAAPIRPVPCLRGVLGGDEGRDRHGAALAPGAGCDNRCSGRRAGRHLWLDYKHPTVRQQPHAPGDRTHCSALPVPASLSRATPEKQQQQQRCLLSSRLQPPLSHLHTALRCRSYRGCFSVAAGACALFLYFLHMALAPGAPPAHHGLSPPVSRAAVSKPNAAQR